MSVAFELRAWIPVYVPRLSTYKKHNFKYNEYNTLVDFMSKTGEGIKYIASEIITERLICASLFTIYYYFFFW